MLLSRILVPTLDLLKLFLHQEFVIEKLTCTILGY